MTVWLQHDNPFQNEILYINTYTSGNVKGLNGFFWGLIRKGLNIDHGMSFVIMTGDRIVRVSMGIRVNCIGI